MNKMLQNIFNSHHMVPIVFKSVQTLGVTQEQQLLISSARLTDCFPGFDSNSAIFPLRRNPLFFKGHHSQCNPSFVVIVRWIQNHHLVWPLTSHPLNQEETIHCQSWVPGSLFPLWGWLKSELAPKAGYWGLLRSIKLVASRECCILTLPTPTSVLP